MIRAYGQLCIVLERDAVRGLNDAPACEDLSAT